MEEKNNKIKYIFRLFWIFIIGSLVGFMYENILVLIKKGHFELRQGLLYGPLIPVYGIGAIVYEEMATKIKNTFQFFIYTMFFGGVVEYICSYLQEVLFGTISWDYHWVQINFNGRTSLLHAFDWGIAGILFYKIVHPWFTKVMNKDLTNQIVTVTCCLMAFIVIDILISWSALARQKARLLDIPPNTRIDRFLDHYYPDERIDKIYTNKVVTIENYS